MKLVRYKICLSEYPNFFDDILFLSSNMLVCVWYMPCIFLLMTRQHPLNADNAITIGHAAVLSVVTLYW